MKKNIIKKSMAILITLAMVLSLMPALTLTASAAWNGADMTAFTVGNGLSGSPYEIASAEQLAYMAAMINGAATNATYAGLYYKLTADIDLNSQNWTPIGTQTAPFTGNFDGGNFKISRLRINTTVDSSKDAFIGLFGIIGGSAALSNTTLESVDIDVAADSGTGGESFVGGLVGINMGTVSNCHVSGTLDAVSYDLVIGGLVGNNGADGTTEDGDVTDCSSDCTINATVNYQTGHIGGLVGCSIQTGSSIAESTSAGTITGIGEASAGHSGVNSGGLVGYISTSTITDCSSSCTVIAKEVHSQANAGGLIGAIAGINMISGCSSTGNATASDAAGSEGTRICSGGLIGYSFSSSTISDCHSSGNASATGTGSSASIAYAFSGGFLGYISLGGSAVEISQCYSTGDATSTVNTSGQAHSGGFGGYYMTAHVSKCYCIGNASAVSIQGYASSGGFTGYIYGDNAATSPSTLTNCYSMGNASSDCPTRERTGGLSGVIHNSTATNCYSTGIPSTIKNVSSASGGLTGINNAGTISNCYYDTTTSGKTDTDRGAPMSTLDMKKASFIATLVGADWKHVSNLNSGYPILDGVGVGALPTCTVTYMDGLATYTTDVVAQGSSFTVATAPAAASGLAFAGWFTGSDGSGTEYLSNSTLAPNALTLTLNAKWAAAAPTVTSISPSSGPTAGGTAVTITGTNLSGATSVAIGGTAAIGVEVVNATTITATTPAGAAGAANVVVTTPGGTGTGSGLFTYVSTDVTPPSSPIYSPVNSTTNVAVSITPTLTFCEALYSNASATAMGATPTGVIKVYEGTNNTGTALTEGSGSDFTVAYNSTNHVFTVSFGASLKNSQSYYVELQANKVYDAAGDTISSAQGVTFTTKPADITAPVLSATSSSSVTSTGATLNFTSNEAGTYYYLIYAGAATAPNAATVKAQGAAVAKGTAAATASANTAAVTGLSASTAYKAYVIVEDVAGNKSAVSAIDVTTTAASTGGLGGGSPAAATPTVVEVNGQAQDAGTSRTETVNGKVQETILVDAAKLDTILDKSGDKPIVTLPSSKGSAVTVGELNGQAVKNMEKKEAVLEIRTGTVTYTLPASQINIDSISSQFGSQVALKDIKVSVKIAEPAADAVKAVEDTASKGHYQLVVKPLEFEITCTSGNKTVGINKFKGFVERTVAIPDGVDPKKITTGIVLNADGTFRHVPTEVITVGGKYYAKINSLTNSTYSVIYNPVAFTDVANHWAKTAINDMGSRMVVTGVGSSTYEPDRSITRAEFAAIAVRAMGLAQGTTESSFADVSSSDWFNGYVDTATDYSLITGYDNTSYGPNDTITREQAMAILARAMKLTGLSVSLTDSEVSAVLANYTDGASVLGYAKASAAACIKTGIVSGTGATTISPKAYVTRAEVAVMVQRMLQKAELI